MAGHMLLSPSQESVLENHKRWPSVQKQEQLINQLNGNIVFWILFGFSVFYLEFIFTISILFGYLFRFLMLLTCSGLLYFI